MLATIIALLLISSIVFAGCGIISAETVTRTNTVWGTVTVDKPVLISDLTDSAIEPFAWQSMFYANVNSDSFTVPADKRLVIEWVTASFRCPPPDPGSPPSMVLPWIQATFESEQVIYFLAISNVQVDHNQYTRFTTTQFVKIYTDPGALVEMGYSFSGPAPEPTVYSVSGYLVDAP